MFAGTLSGVTNRAAYMTKRDRNKLRRIRGRMAFGLPESIAEEVRRQLEEMVPFSETGKHQAKRRNSGAIPNAKPKPKPTNAQRNDGRVGSIRKGSVADQIMRCLSTNEAQAKTLVEITPYVKGRETHVSTVLAQHYKGGNLRRKLIERNNKGRGGRNSMWAYWRVR